MNAAYVSALSALAGSAIGALASFATTWLTQHYQDRVQRAAQESSRRERLFGDFIDEASKLFADAMVSGLESPSKLVHLYAIMGKLRLFASESVIAEADRVMERIVETYYAPNENIAAYDAARRHSHDLLREFSKVCQNELRG